ncbi:MAG: hypothetical protein CSYNP_01770 [Syntrophus sp. SKADARSKE-3]|nr:hypothetical protein [Syntrophus sp. SKADARSKE-3]
MDESLKDRLDDISTQCIECPACQKSCVFLQNYGTPKTIADAFEPDNAKNEHLPFECSLCGLCAAVCPVGLRPDKLFLEMRREKVRREPDDFAEHSGLLAYEKRGVSRLFTWYGLPPGCDTVLFPGCALAGTRPQATLKLYGLLRQSVPTLGIVLDCCLKISHDLGRQAYFQAMFREMNHYLVENGIRKVLVACPNCYMIFKAYGEGLAIETIYETLVTIADPTGDAVRGAVTIHDPCALRFTAPVHDAVRRLVEGLGLTVEEMIHRGKETLCCGGGGSVVCLSPRLADAWASARKEEAQGRRIVTYCAGCAGNLDLITPASHIVDLLCDPKGTMAGNTAVAKSPRTYLNRLLLKRRLRKTIDTAISRERTYTGAESAKKSVMGKRIFLLVALAAIIVSMRLSGATRYLEGETLRQLIESYSLFAPAVYILIYAVAPVFMLPGLPITIMGGVLFGPFWGVIYTITGATMGACLAFIVSRYIARDWVEKKIHSPRWRRLDKAVETQGWKVVVFTRLIPVFPFNLLNYAFGLTKVRFFPYAVASFFGMIPATVAYIVFSSSLLDLVRGRISPALVIGAVLIIVVSMIPLVYRRFKGHKGGDDLF